MLDILTNRRFLGFSSCQNDNCFFIVDKAYAEQLLSSFKHIQIILFEI